MPNAHVSTMAMAGIGMKHRPQSGRNAVDLPQQGMPFDPRVRCFRDNAISGLLDGAGQHADQLVDIGFHFGSGFLMAGALLPPVFSSGGFHR
jgi:hypothetical protein